MEALPFFADRAASGSLSHAYLVWGHGDMLSREAALRAVARLFEPEPFADCLVIRPRDGAIGIDDAREAARFLRMKPLRSSRRIAIVLDAGSATPEAQNALLKILEEPPPFGLLLFSASDPRALLPALRSRLQAVFVPGASAAIVPEDAALAAAWVTGPAARRKDIVKKLIEAEDVPAFDRFGAAVMAHLAADPVRNIRVLKELSHRLTLIAERSVNRRLQWDAVSSYL